MKHKESCGLRGEGNELFRVFPGFLDKLFSFATTSLDVTPPKRRPVPVPVVPETAAAGVSLRLKKKKKKRDSLRLGERAGLSL